MVASRKQEQERLYVKLTGENYIKIDKRGVFYMNYPDPCLKCEKNNGGTCNRYNKCYKWLTRYMYRQKQINAYAKKVLPAYYAKKEGHNG